MSNKKRVVVLGAGPAGMAAAHHLSLNGYNVSVIDRAHYLGGASASFRIKDYIVDYGPHAFHDKNKEIVDIVRKLIGDDYVEVKRKTRLILDGNNMAYPLNIKEALLKINPLLSLKVIFDYFLVKIKNRLSNAVPKTFEDWGINAFGYTLYRLAFGDYSEKMWGVSGRELSLRLAQQKLMKLNLWKLMLKVLGIGDAALEGGVTTYYDIYPRYGIGTIFNKMGEIISGYEGNEIYLDSQINKIHTADGKANKISFSHEGQDKDINFDYLVSTIPLKYLAQYLSFPDSSKAISLAQKLKYRDVRIIYVVLDKDYYSDIHWIYLLDSHFKFNRLSEQKNLNKESSPPGKTVISLDIACNYNDEVWNMSNDDLFELALGDLNHLGIERDHVLEHFSLRLKDIYPIYGLDFEDVFSNLTGILSMCPNLYSTGRQGLFLNNDIHDSMEMGILSSKFIMENTDSQKWYEHTRGYIKKRLEGTVK